MEGEPTDERDLKNGNKFHILQLVCTQEKSINQLQNMELISILV